MEACDKTTQSEVRTRNKIELALHLRICYIYNRNNQNLAVQFRKKFSEQANNPRSKAEVTFFMAKLT